MGNHVRMGKLAAVVTDNPALLGVAGIGFAVSFQTIVLLARSHHLPGWPVLYPLGIDVGILALIIESRKAIDAHRSDLVPRVLAWALAALTIYVNAHGAPPHDWLGRTLHVVMPALWVAFLELTRWRKLARRRADDRRDRIPLARWAASPVATVTMWRRMILHNITSYPVAVAREEARILALDLAAAVYGKRWKREAPSLLRHHLKTGTLPGDVARTCDLATAGHMPSVADQVEAWVTGEKVNRAKVVAKVKREERAIDAPLPLPAPSPKPRARKRARTTSGERDRKNQMARQLLTGNPGMLREDVAREAGVSPRTVDRIKGELRDKGELPRGLSAVR